MDRDYVALTAMGPDNKGIVEALSGFLFDAGANLEDSRMAVLGEQFAVILLVSGESGLLDVLRPGIASLQEKTGLAIAMQASKQRWSNQKGGVPCKLSAVCLDNPGIVHKLSHAVAQRGANIESLDSACSPAPLTGSPLFSLKIVCSLPVDVRFSKFKAELEEVGDGLGIDLSLSLLEG